MTVRHAAHHLLRSAAGFPRTTRHASRQTQLPSFFRRGDSRCIVSVCKKYLRPPPTTQLQAQQQHPNSPPSHSFACRKLFLQPKAVPSCRVLA